MRSVVRRAPCGSARRWLNWSRTHDRPGHDCSRARLGELVNRIGVGFVAALLLQATPAAAIEIGQAAPDFTLQDVNGASHTLSALRGKAVLLAFIGYG